MMNGTWYCTVMGVVLGCFVFVFSSGSTALGADAQDRAGELQTWREQCADPDPDLRLAYLENAIANGDVSVLRICIRLALQSDNADIRNLGLRAAITATPRITFMPTMPKALEQAYKRTGDNEQK
ncbi:MAG: hypothetical protein PHI96_08095, partial [Desulfovibrio sp.]|nr:hypothetical protein [Desulfovibrio sp.]